MNTKYITLHSVCKTVSEYKASERQENIKQGRQNVNTRKLTHTIRAAIQQAADKGTTRLNYGNERGRKRRKLESPTARSPISQQIEDEKATRKPVMYPPCLIQYLKLGSPLVIYPSFYLS